MLTVKIKHLFGGYKSTYQYVMGKGLCLMYIKLSYIIVTTRRFFIKECCGKFMCANITSNASNIVDNSVIFSQIGEGYKLLFLNQVFHGFNWGFCVEDYEAFNKRKTRYYCKEND